MKTSLGFFAILGFLVSINYGQPPDPSKPLRLDQLDDWSLLNIFDHVDFIEMIHLAEANDGFRQLVLRTYLLPVFHIDKKVIHLTANKDQLFVQTTTIRILGVETILAFLRNFGHLISALKFDERSFEIDQAMEITKSIKQYCSKTVTDLELIAAGAHFTKMNFPRVTTLKLMDPVAIENMQLHRMYPALEDLTIELYFESNIPLNMAQFHRNLKSLKIVEKEMFPENAGLFEFLRVNRNIRKLSLSRLMTFEDLQFISETLKDLDSLAIAYDPQISSEPLLRAVHFDSVKHFTILELRSASEPHVTPMTFTHLESLDILLGAEELFTRDLLRQNNDVKSLSFPKMTTGDVYWLLSETGPFNSLEVLTIGMHMNMFAFNSGVIIEYPALKTVIINKVISAGEKNDETINALVPRGWNWTDYQFRYKFFGVIVSRQ